jgi:hypothetical protein
MTEISFPPLHDLSPGEHEKRKQHLLSEIRREPERRRFSLPTIPPLRLRFVAPAAAAVGVAAVCAVVFSGALGGSGTHRSSTSFWSAHNNTLPNSSVGPGALRPGITTLGNDNPFGADGKLVTLQQFVADKAKEGYGVPLPNSPLANSDNVGNVWENTATGEVIVYYPSSGIELNYGGTGLDYTGIPASDIQTINGVRAIVFPAGSPESYFSSVSLPIPSGHLVDLLSKGPVSDLVSVAQTMTVTGG